MWSKVSVSNFTDGPYACISKNITRIRNRNVSSCFYLDHRLIVGSSHMKLNFWMFCKTCLLNLLRAFIKVIIFQYTYLFVSLFLIWLKIFLYNFFFLIIFTFFLLLFLDIDLIESNMVLLCSVAILSLKKF